MGGERSKSLQQRMFALGGADGMKKGATVLMNYSFCEKLLQNSPSKFILLESFGDRYSSFHASSIMRAAMRFPI